MTIVTLTNTLQDGTLADATEVMANFQQLVNAFNGEIDKENLSAVLEQWLFTTGDLKPSAAASAPTGWLLCDGSPVSRTAYADLWNAIRGGHAGTVGDPAPYGNGDGSSTFNVPDLRGRFPLGAGTGTGLTARTPGAKGGDENYSGNVLLQGGAGPFFASILTGAGPGFSADTGTGGGGASQMPPFQVVNWLIKT